MKKIITSLLANFAVITSSTPLMANQIPSQEIENMRTKVDFWIEKTSNWRNYIAEEFRCTYYSAPSWHFFTENALNPNNNEVGIMRRLEYLGNYVTNPTQPTNERRWFDCELTYYPDRTVNLNCHVSRWNPTRILIKDFQMNDYLITSPANKNYFRPTTEYDSIIVKTYLNNGNLDIGVCFFYSTGCDDTDRQSLSNEQRYHITSNHNSSTKINIKITGTLIYRIREDNIQQLHNKLLLIRQQLNDPKLAQDAYRTHLSFMNLES